MTITITVRKNSSLLISADDAAHVRLVDHDGVPLQMPPEGKAIALCRCGLSQRMPFCDAAHKTGPFVSAEIGCRVEESQG